MKHCLLVVFAITTFAILPGCGGGNSTASSPSASDSSNQIGDANSDGDSKRWPTSRKPWWTLAIDKARDAVGYGLEVVHDGTGWILGKATVNIEQIGDARDTTQGKLADFRITVTSSDESFTSEIKDIPCDELGIPNDDSQAKFDEAVEKIKQMLTKLQS